MNYLDSATLAVVNPLICEDLGLSIAGIGLLLSAFLWSYAFRNCLRALSSIGLDRTAC